jgi:chromosome segregation ATPase
MAKHKVTRSEDHDDKRWSEMNGVAPTMNQVKAKPQAQRAQFVAKCVQELEVDVNKKLECQDQKIELASQSMKAGYVAHRSRLLQEITIVQGVSAKVDKLVKSEAKLLVENEELKAETKKLKGEIDHLEGTVVELRTDHQALEKKYEALTNHVIEMGNAFRSTQQIIGYTIRNQDWPPVPHFEGQPMDVAMEEDYQEDDTTSEASDSDYVEESD